jgi:hypothetical protein
MALLAHPVELEDRETRSDEPALYARIEAEFREMPGLTLTLPQAARLFNLVPPRCERVLGALLCAGLLVRHDGMYARADCGRRCA